MRTRLGHYDIVSELGRGGMGVVYKGYETLAQPLRRDQGAGRLAGPRRGASRSASCAKRAAWPRSTIRTSSRSTSSATTRARPIFVMEFVEGESLGSMLKRDHRLSVEQAAKIIQQTAMGLSTAHDRGVVHRDIKPGNLMIYQPRRGQDRRLRHRAVEPGPVEEADLDRRVRRHAGLSVARGLPRQAGRSALGHLLARHRAVRDADRHACRSPTSPRSA